MRLYQNIFLLSFIAFGFFLTMMLLAFEPSNNNGDSNLVTGNVVLNNVTTTRVQVVATQSKSCSFTVYEGWNLVSFYCLGMLVNRSDGLASLGDGYKYIFKYQANDAADPWKSYNPELPNWTVQQLQYLDRITGYWIYMNQSENFSYFGIYSPSSIPLYSGWNLISYPRNSSANISTILSSIPYTVVVAYDNPSNTYPRNVNGGSGNTLTQFDTYKGYWVNVSNNVQLNMTT